MALYQPSYMSPRNSTIDATVEEQMQFSCQLNGNSLLYGYDIIIYNAETNAEVFKLSSNKSKEILQKELNDANSNLSQTEKNITDRENLLEELADDNTDTNFQNTLNQTNTDCTTKLSQMNECLIGLRPTSEFFTIGDQIISEITSDRELAKQVQDKIETHYLVVLADYQKRLSNNSIQLDTNVTRYNRYKAANQMNSQTISLLQRILNYLTENVSTDDSSTKRIIAEYWDEILPTLQEQIDTLNEEKKNIETRIKSLETAINNLSKGMYMLTTPMYPVDYQGNNNVLVHQLPTSILTNGTNYKWTITLYWSSENNGDNLDKNIVSQEAYFECRTMPTIEISNFTNILNRRYYEFVGEYTQKEHVPVTYFRWILTQAITGEVLEDTGNIPSTDIRFYYDGFLNDYEYTIQLFVENQNNITVNTEPMKFKVSYVGLLVDNVVTATPNTEEHGIIVEWSGIHGVEGTIYGDYTYIKDLPVVTHTSLELPKGSSLVFDKDNDDTLKVPATTATHVISIRIDSPDIETIYEATGSNGGLPYYKKLTLDGNDLVYDINGVKQIRKAIVPSPLYWYVIFMLPDKLIVSVKWADGLFPSTTLYPHIGLYPKALSYHNTEGEVLI